MKKMFLSVIVAFPALVMAQDGEYTLKGKVGQLNAPAKAYLNTRVGGKSVMDSTDIKGGVFTFKGTTAGITRGSVIIDHAGVGAKALMRGADLKTVYLEKGT